MSARNRTLSWLAAVAVLVLTPVVIVTSCAKKQASDKAPKPESMSAAKSGDKKKHVDGPVQGLEPKTPATPPPLMGTKTPDAGADADSKNTKGMLGMKRVEDPTD